MIIWSLSGLRNSLYLNKYFVLLCSTCSGNERSSGRATSYAHLGGTYHKDGGRAGIKEHRAACMTPYYSPHILSQQSRRAKAQRTADRENPVRLNRREPPASKYISRRLPVELDHQEASQHPVQTNQTRPEAPTLRKKTPQLTQQHLTSVRT